MTIEIREEPPKMKRLERNTVERLPAGVDDDPADTAAGAWLETLLGRAKIKQTATDPAAAIRCAFRTGYLIGQRVAKE